MTDQQNNTEKEESPVVEEPPASGEIVERDAKGKFVEGHTKLGGRTFGSKNFSRDFDEVIEEIALVNKISQSEARKILIKKAYVQAKDGNFPFYKDILDRYYGKPTEYIEADIRVGPLEETNEDPVMREERLKIKEDARLKIIELEERSIRNRALAEQKKEQKHELLEENTKQGERDQDKNTPRVPADMGKGEGVGDESKS